MYVEVVWDRKCMKSEFEKKIIICFIICMSDFSSYNIFDFFF